MSDYERGYRDALKWVLGRIGIRVLEVSFFHRWPKVFHTLLDDIADEFKKKH